MVVESDGHMQDIFRKSFKHAGYRVLVTADPGRAAGRFRQDADVADCVLFSAQQIGQHALDMFNQLGEDKRTESVPAILLLNESQHPWKSKANTADHRIVLLDAADDEAASHQRRELLVADSRSPQGGPTTAVRSRLLLVPTLRPGTPRFDGSPRLPCENTLGSQGGQQSSAALERRATAFPREPCEPGCGPR